MYYWNTSEKLTHECTHSPHSPSPIRHEVRVSEFVSLENSWVWNWVKGVSLVSSWVRWGAWVRELRSSVRVGSSWVGWAHDFSEFMSLRVRRFEQLLLASELSVANTGGTTFYKPPSTFSDLNVTDNNATLQLSWKSFPDTMNSDHFPIWMTMPGCSKFNTKSYWVTLSVTSAVP